ncbi:sporulation protein YtfJ [Pontibacillus yanchengensis]|uniref:Sporulation protein YtfJ n=2 Tax=Pontibacillus yanchengensis TaxID=462910 RepID=A0ACC7VCQ6_9BACI|nr:GerW family sporulation protein [Pontibacillus yanchengensis]MYL34110.1 sporulation protein YtfJ [Pontibacillus yanchengensis]MYL53203.1 sporulation protein YtfJ [Pontibacillus yanchengensis]
MSEHPIQGLMTTAMENLKDMIDVNTIIGDPVETPDGSTLIITVSKVGFGFAAGGSEFHINSNNEQDNGGQGSDADGELPFGGGSGGGVSITPIAFLIVNKSSGVKMIHLDEHAHLYERLLDLAPQAVEKIQEALGKKSDKDKKNGSHSSKQSQQNQDGSQHNQNGSQNNQNFSW